MKAGPVRIAVIGVGYMGERHAAKASLLERQGGDLRLVGVADTDFRRASRIARELGTRSASDGRDLFEHADAVICQHDVAHANRYAECAGGLNVRHVHDDVADPHGGPWICAGHQCSSRS